MLPAGSRVGDYEIEAELGEGGMARVYRARHALLDTPHAVKVLDSALRTNADARQRFLDEARIQAKHLDHPGIVKVTNIVATADHAALVMELIEGSSLEALMHELVNDPAEIRRIMLAVLDAVGHAHAAGIVHRDLKPANVLLAGKGRVPKVSDFGIAKLSDPERAASKKSTHAGARMGTLAYMSPEQIRRAKDVTPRSDIFSLGAMLYELATGAMPFEGADDFEVMEKIVHGRYRPPAEVNPRIDPVFVTVIDKALESAPGDRYQSCDDMAAALREDLKPVARPQDSVPNMAPPKSRVNLAIGGAVAGLVVIGAALFVVDPGGGSEPDPVRPPVVEDLAIYRKALGLHGKFMSATIETSAGIVRCNLLHDQSPIGVANFIGLASGQKPWRDGAGRIHTNQPYYDGTAVYRVIPAFLVQAGRPADTLDVPSNPGYTFADEKSALIHLPGSLALANSGPDTNGAELVFVLERAQRLDGTETIIGKCPDITVLTAISTLDRDSKDRPLLPVTIRSVRFEDKMVGLAEKPVEEKKQEKKQAKPERIHIVPLEGSPVEGPSDAKVTIVAFLDLAEPYSGKLWPSLRKVMRERAGSVNLVIKHVTVHPGTGNLAGLAMCAARNQGKAHAFAEAVWAELPRKDITPASLRKVAVSLGLDRAKFDADVDGALCWSRFETDTKLFGKLGITGVPQTFINGRGITGAQPYEKLLEMVDEELKSE
ncbi:MAG: protein kinase [Deltaproteobacteria bacterium]|nr:protein kinase [Deltaproteobacteria bacterium]